MKYNKKYNVALCAVMDYAAAKKRINTLYKIQKPDCKKEEYTEYILKNGFSKRVPESLFKKNDCIKCRNAEIIINNIFEEHPDKAELWSFILTENFFKDQNTVQKKLILLEEKKIYISRATYYREIDNFINEIAEASGLGNEYVNKKPAGITPEEAKKGKRLFI